MGDRIKPIIGAWATGCVVGYVAVTNFFNPAMPAPAFEPVVANLIAQYGSLPDHRGSFL